MTANELIRRSLRSLGVLYHNESPTSDEATDALATLNDMLNAWLLEGMDLEVYENLELTDTLPYPDDHISAMRYGLAVELAPKAGQGAQALAQQRRPTWQVREQRRQHLAFLAQ